MRSSRRFPQIIGALLAAMLLALPTLTHADTQPEKTTVPPALDFTLDNIDGQPTPLRQYHGKVLLLVNVASRCGHTPQYKDLQALYDKYHEQGLVVLGIPANDFGKQEPGSDEQIKEFCSLRYNVTFPMFSKIVVKGEGQHPLYQFLTGEKTNPQFPGQVKWNFEKFLIGRDGQVIGRFASGVKPMGDQLVQAVEAALAK